MGSYIHLYQAMSERALPKGGVAVHMRVYIHAHAITSGQGDYYLFLIENNLDGADQKLAPGMQPQSLKLPFITSLLRGDRLIISFSSQMN